MGTNQVVLREYAGDGWQDRIVTGEAASEVEQWLAEIESKTPRAPGASGKPLAWLCFVDDVAGDSRRKKVVRSIGLLTDVLRILDRDITVEELQRLRGIFDRDGLPFHGTLED